MCGIFQEILETEAQGVCVTVNCCEKTQLPLFPYNRGIKLINPIISRGLYGPIIRIPVIKGGIFPIPNIRS